jgi:predicted porin
MKKSLLAVAVLGAFAGAASAQSSVTLFGVVDLSGNYIENGDQGVYSLRGDQLASNRLGFRGTEDLGGGLAAGFWLEAGFAPDTGTAGGGNGITGQTAFFNRRSTLSLISKVGELRLGRDYAPTFNNNAAGDVYGANGLGNTTNMLAPNSAGTTVVGANVGVTYPTYVRTNNSIGYFLPGGLGGFYGQFQVSAGEREPNQKAYGGRLGYAAGPFDIGAAYGMTDNGDTPDFKVWNIAGSWNFGIAKVFGLYQENEFGPGTVKMYSVSAVVPLGQGEFKAGYTASDSQGSVNGVSIDPDNGKLYSLQYIYNLSKRTALYTTFARIDNDGKANFQVGGNGYQGSGQASQGYNFGVRHSF